MKPDIMKPDMRNTLIVVHKTNIERYRRLLKTHLSVIERAFVERRLDEEEEMILELVQRGARFDCRDAA